MNREERNFKLYAAIHALPDGLDFLHEVNRAMMELYKGRALVSELLRSAEMVQAFYEQKNYFNMPSRDEVNDVIQVAEHWLSLIPEKNENFYE